MNHDLFLTESLNTQKTVKRNKLQLTLLGHYFMNTYIALSIGEERTKAKKIMSRWSKRKTQNKKATKRNKQQTDNRYLISPNDWHC